MLITLFIYAIGYASAGFYGVGIAALLLLIVEFFLRKLEG